jgi:hypothetical protein
MAANKKFQEEDQRQQKLPILPVANFRYSRVGLIAGGPNLSSTKNSLRCVILGPALTETTR